MMESNSRRGKHRIDVENAIIRRREKQFNYDMLWNDTKQYFSHWEKANSKFERWTSPRYYEDNNKLMEFLKTKKEREESLKIRREKLKKLLEDEHNSYQVELMMQRNKILLDIPTQTTHLKEIPTNVLKEVNIGLKLHEDERRRHEAEMKLYQQWRTNNPVVKQFESKFRSRDLKFSWLDQQIEKRMQKEKEEEENKRLLKEREEMLKKEEEREKAFKIYLEEKRLQLRKHLEEQMEELKQKRLLTESLKKEEQEEILKQNALANLEELRKKEEKEKADRECALFNIQQYKMKLKRRAHDIQKNVKQDEFIIARLKGIELEKILSDAFQRKEIEQALNEFLIIVKEQKELEKQRQRHLEFLFDSEARAVFERQSEIWRQEENSRKKFLDHVLETLKKQIEHNICMNKEQQKKILLEQEAVTNKIEEYNKELQKLKYEEETRKNQRKKNLDDDIKIKNVKKKMDENIKLREINEELERIRKEEDRLKQEILRIQQNCVPNRFKRTNKF